ncbi:MAG: phosphoenolpyruvate synthase [Lachnospiraceae bacterium]|nr:phosphoenolpyruvate synthase [Lachnospiraceae bacterium]
MFGNKINNLLALKNAGQPVPEFEVIAFEDIIDTTKYENLLEAYLAAHMQEDSAEKRQDNPTAHMQNLRTDELSELLSSCVRKDFKSSFENTFSHLGDAVAVRSSCKLEDSDKQSFAGQFSTFLNVPAYDIFDKVLQCLKSLFSENVLTYLDQKMISPRELVMDVIIQKMIPSDISGVLFTSNPQGILNESVIVAGRGLGEGVVLGRVDTTTYYYHLADKLYYYEGKEDLLPNNKVELLIHTAKKITGILGEYIDLEFAFFNDNLYILQARKITTIKDDSPLILDNSNIVESYPGTSLPLTVSFVKIIYGGVFKGVSRRVLKNERELKKHEDVFYNMVGNANGRIYYKISNWYTVLKFLPFHNKIIPVWQEMLGVKNKSYDANEVNLSLPVRIMTYVNSFCELITVPRHMKKLEDNFTKVNNWFYESFSDDSTPKELLEMYGEIKDKLLSIWDITLLNDMYAFIFTGLVKSRLTKKYNFSEAECNNYISGISNIESMKPVKALLELAYHFDEYSEDEYAQKKADYIRQYGDRNLEELKLESETFRSSPKLLDEKINYYRKNLKRLEQSYKDVNSARNSMIKTDILTRFLVNRCSVGIAGREKSRLNRSRIFGIVRLIFTTIGDNFARRGILDDKRDIFYLTVEEVFEIVGMNGDLTGNASDDNGLDDSGLDRFGSDSKGLNRFGSDSFDINRIKSIVNERKENYKLYEVLPPYSRLIFAGEEFDKTHISINTYKRKQTTNVLQGVPCSGGITEGEALVIDNVKNLKDVSDKILVTKMTDPGWVFLLATAKGVLSEKGSLLSHTAIISRELKIPAIVGIDNLLDTIESGDYLRIDAGTGKIEILRRK